MTKTLDSIVHFKTCFINGHNQNNIKLTNTLKIDKLIYHDRRNIVNFTKGTFMKYQTKSINDKTKKLKL